LKKGFSKTTMKNGVRVISEHIPSVRSVSIGIWVHVGSRDEAPKVNGISHFIEHMHFKRTGKRNAMQIAQTLEALGGSINAFTSREHTCYYARILNEHLPIAMDVLGDILNNSRFTPGDIQKEKLVILEEIKDVMDTPSEYVHDLFGLQMWKSAPLGQPIMGLAENVAGLTRKTILHYINDHYCGPNIVIAAAGDISHARLLALTKKYFQWSRPGTAKEEIIPQHNGFSLKSVRNRTKQSQVCLGFPSISFANNERYALLATNAILSGGMSSRLFQSVREKAGYCYNISSYQEFFRDSGIFCVYYGVDAKYVIKASNLVLKELKKLKKNLLSHTELKQVKEQLKGSLMLSQESTYNRMNRIARQELMLGAYITLDETIDNINAITAGQIRDIANAIFDRNHLTMTTLGPTKTKELEEINWSLL